MGFSGKKSSSSPEIGNKDFKFSLTVMLNRERNKVLYAVADNHFTDILLSFLTLPLGRILKILENHYGEKKAPTIGSLTTFSHSLANLNSSYFVTYAAKKALLNPRSTFEADYEKLKLDFTDSPPAEFFNCRKCYRFRSVSLYYDKVRCCFFCTDAMNKVVEKSSAAAAASSDGVFTKSRGYFLISDDLLVVPQEAAFLKIISILGITNTDDSESIKVDFGLNEIMDLLKASLTSPTPLSDVILNKKTRMNMNTPVVGSQTKEKTPKCGNFTMKVMIQKSTGKLLHARASEDFVEILFSLLFVPLGGALEHLLAGEPRFGALCNLQRSASEFIDSDYFKDMDMKNRVTIPNLIHGCISKKHIPPLTEQCLPSEYNEYTAFFSSETFPEGKGRYLKRPQSYRVKDDLSVEPYCFVSILSSLREQGIMVSDVEELDVMIGANKFLSILKASLTSTSALSDALLPHKPNKQPKRELI